MATPHVLMFGANGGTGRAITKVMLEKSWRVTAVIRQPAQKEGILRLGAHGKLQPEVLVQDLQHLNQQDADRIIEEVRPNYIVFAAGSMSNPNAVDRDAAKRVINSATASPTVTKFLVISFPASRRNRAPWWDDKDFQSYQQEKNSYPQIANAKLEADEHLVAMAKKREKSGGAPFHYISLRPSWLTNGPKGKVTLGHTRSLGQVPRASVAEVAVTLLQREVSGWFDLLDGNTEIGKAVDDVIRNGTTSLDGEDVDRIYKLADKAT
ncbi:hypothetical protein BKA61DRAFT_597700 [Leptodontidium sp. MPI-SDFR-AT-0119]|nr:hypothetical protein BKA61DRAFT_597700 [Leptodontidium sp. MPI-SDFR-AT-0119]